MLGAKLRRRRVCEPSEPPSEVGLIVEATHRSDRGDGFVGLEQHLRGRVDSNSQDVLSGGQAEDLSHASLELRLGTFSDHGELRDANGLRQVLADVDDDVLQPFERDVFLARSEQVPTDGHEADESTGFVGVAHWELRGEVPTEIAARPANQLELIEEGFAGFEDRAVLLFVTNSKLWCEMVGGLRAYDVPLRPFARAPNERRVDLDVTSVEILHAEHHVDESLEKRNQLRLTGEDPITR